MSPQAEQGKNTTEIPKILPSGQKCSQYKFQKTFDLEIEMTYVENKSAGIFLLGYFETECPQKRICGDRVPFLCFGSSRLVCEQLA